ncbi:hypothetical protein [Desulfovibrio ferrophilus]|uniref:Rad50/SbcC-type AAA domain-containing protein n=1 Tax=Desulfovibrio ferrophilus TaxID=241368 RepID=A0A2Z6AZ16_9BACT|nr:hypothetical protein [Desulfovibrio ferrophilus]BBD08433.1 putative uncharacterized protein [Desulfovibrio ferrophilus]
MKIEIGGWKSKNLRCPDIEVSLNHNGILAPISLIQMPNGTGKTTTLNLLRASMSGEAQSWDKNTILRYKRRDSDFSTGFFETTLLIDDRPLTFELTLDFQNETATYTTTSPGSGGITKGWNPPTQAHRFLTEKFVRLFVFDGEFADSLLDARQSEAENAIDALCQLYLLNEIENEAESIWKKATQNSSSKTTKGLNKWRNKASKIHDRIESIEKKLKKHNDSISENNARLIIIKTEMSKHTNNEEQNRILYFEKLELQEAAENKSKEIALELLSLIRTPHVLTKKFTNNLTSLKHQLDTLKLPSSTSKQFFIELLEEDECICGRPMDGKARSVVKKKAEQYLAEETSGFLNGLKQDIDQFLQPEGSSHNDFKTKLDELRLSIIHKKRVESETRAAHDAFIDSGGEELKILEEERKDLETKNEKTKKIIDEFQREPAETDDAKTNCLKSLERQYKEARKKVAEISDTLDLQSRTETLKKIARQALEKSRRYIREELTNECNSKLDVILSRSPLKIESIGESLKLKNQDGASVGQTLSVGYTFLTNLLHRGKHQFPLIVDSPANPISFEVRQEIGKIIPKLCKQFVAFTISPERAGFVTALEKNCEHGIHYMTIFGKSEGTQELLHDIDKYEHAQNDTCALVYGKQYFMQFDRDLE